MKDLSLEEKIGQMLMFGTMEKDITPLYNLIKDYKIGGVILYKNNYSSYSELKQVVKSLKEANKDNKIPLFIAIDQEGGVVNRLPNDIINLKNIYDVSKLDNVEYIERHADIISNILYNTGINMNFAPVLDVYNGSNSKVLNKRCFSENVDKVSLYGKLYMQKVNSNGIISVVKHFPGHGLTKRDTHLFVPYIFDSKKVLEHVAPFKNCIDNGCDAVMVSHLVIRGMTDLLPASISKRFISKYLRKKCNYSGLVITDDIRMKSVDVLYKSISLKCAFNSGSDVILFKYNDNDEEVINKIVDMVKNKTIKIRNINNSVDRIISLKKKYNISDSDFGVLDIEMVNKEIEDFNSKINSF